MQLAMRISQSESETFPLVLSVARSSPKFQTETEGRTPACLAIFPDLSLSFDVVERRIGAVAELQDVRVPIDERPVKGPTHLSKS